jgi:hypothetical protein
MPGVTVCPLPTRIKDGKGGGAGRVATEPLDSLAAKQDARSNIHDDVIIGLCVNGDLFH